MQEVINKLQAIIDIQWEIAMTALPCDRVDSVARKCCHCNLPLNLDGVKVAKEILIGIQELKKVIKVLDFEKDSKVTNLFLHQSLYS
jgi:hypothetical protein